MPSICELPQGSAPGNKSTKKEVASPKLRGQRLFLSARLRDRGRHGDAAAGTASRRRRRAHMKPRPVSAAGWSPRDSRRASNADIGGGGVDSGTWPCLLSIPTPPSTRLEGTRSSQGAASDRPLAGGSAGGRGPGARGCKPSCSLLASSP